MKKETHKMYGLKKSIPFLCYKIFMIGMAVVIAIMLVYGSVLQLKNRDKSLAIENDGYTPLTETQNPKDVFLDSAEGQYAVSALTYLKNTVGESSENIEIVKILETTGYKGYIFIAVVYTVDGGTEQTLNFDVVQGREADRLAVLDVNAKYLSQNKIPSQMKDEASQIKRITLTEDEHEYVVSEVFG